MKIKLSKKYPATNGQISVGFLSYKIAKETKQHYILDNVSTSDIELIHNQSMDFLIVKNNKTFTYEDSQWRE